MIDDVFDSVEFYNTSDGYTFLVHYKDPTIDLSTKTEEDIYYDVVNFTHKPGILSYSAIDRNWVSGKIAFQAAKLDTSFLENHGLI